jgi:hypothetical protein
MTMFTPPVVRFLGRINHANEFQERADVILGNVE